MIDQIYLFFIPPASTLVVQPWAVRFRNYLTEKKKCLGSHFLAIPALQSFANYLSDGPLEE